MILHRTDLGNARMNEFMATAHRDGEAQRLKNRGSPIQRIRLILARRLVLTGAKLHGEEPAVIGRVVILDQCGQVPQALRPAA
jgi:hypothetical protein